MGVGEGEGEVCTGGRGPSEVLLQRQAPELVDACAWMDGWMGGRLDGRLDGWMHEFCFCTRRHLL